MTPTGRPVMAFERARSGELALNRNRLPALTVA
jgi:hypothetical protein